MLLRRLTLYSASLRISYLFVIVPSIHRVAWQFCHPRPALTYSLKCKRNWSWLIFFLYLFSYFLMNIERFFLHTLRSATAKIPSEISVPFISCLACERKNLFSFFDPSHSFISVIVNSWRYLDFIWSRSRWLLIRQSVSSPAVFDRLRTGNRW